MNPEGAAVSQLVAPVETVYGAGVEVETTIVCGGGELSLLFEVNANCAGIAIRADDEFAEMFKLMGITCGLLVMPAPDMVMAPL